MLIYDRCFKCEEIERTSMSYQPKVGDTVNATYHNAKVVRADHLANGVCLELPGGAYKYVKPDTIDFELVKPAVVTFKPGQKVRSKTAAFVYTIADNGWLWHNGEYTHAYTGNEMDGAWTSECYELVED